jgi:hypothetical protein
MSQFGFILTKPLWSEVKGGKSNNYHFTLQQSNKQREDK